MATIKSYTDIEQSKRLAKILPIESADMEWRNENVDTLIHYTIPFYLEDFEFCDLEKDIPCWSLAALLNVFPGAQVNRMVYSDKWESSSWNDTDFEFEPMLTVGDFDNPVDACVAMIEKLYEQNLL